MIKSEILRKHLEFTSFFGLLRCEELCPFAPDSSRAAANCLQNLLRTQLLTANPESDEYPFLKHPASSTHLYLPGKR